MNKTLFILKSTDGKPLKLDTAADITPHLTELKANPDVEEIRLGGNTLGVEACAALAEVLKTKKNLKIFNAADIFTGRLISEIPDALTHLLTAILTLPSVHTVDLSDNAFGGRLAQPLRDFYSQYGPLQHLLLNNNGLGPEGGSIVASSIADLATLKSTNPSFPPLLTIVCGRNRLENGSMVSWARAYAAHKSLQIVKMVQNGIRPEGIERLLRDGLSHNPDLQILDLQDNTFTLSGARALADVIENWTKLEELGVADTLLSARGGALLGAALQKGNNSLLRKLSLQYNEIDLKGFQELAKAVTASLLKLEIFEMNGNKFCEDEPLVDELRELFSDRGFHGLDSLSDMEEESEVEEEEEEEVEEEEIKEAERQRLVEGDAKRAAEEKVAQEKDTEVDELAAVLGATKLEN